MEKLNIFNRKSTGGGKLSTLLAAFILLLIVTSSTSARADGGDAFVSGNLQYKINEDGKTVELVDYDGDKPSGELVIPASVPYNSKEYSVTSIGDYAFIGCTSLTSVTIPESVKSIGDGAFFACYTLHVTIPNSVTSIEGESTFLNVKHIINQSSCTNDRHWGAIAENGIVDGDFVYENDSKTTLLSYIGKDEEVTIPSGVTSIGNGAFVYCTSLTSVTIPNSVTSIGDGAFGNCSSLTSVTIPNGVTSIGKGAFTRCTSLTSITIPESVTSIGRNAFYEVRHIINKSKCTDPDHWGAFVENGTVDGDLVYEDDTKAKLLVYVGKGGEVTIPDGVTSIGNGAFIYCTSLTSVTIPNSVTSIEDGAFQNCSSLTSVTIPNGVTSIGMGAFADCTSLTSITIPESVTSIGIGAFSSCLSLTSVTIPKSVKSIGMMAFAKVKHIINKSNCTDPEHWGALAENGKVDGDFVYENDTKTTLLAYIGKDKEVTIPDGVTSIGDGAFWGCTSLTSIAISEGVKSIGNNVFRECTNLTSVTIPKSVTSIGDDAFWGCTKITDVYLYANPDNLTWSEDGCDDFIEHPKGKTKCHVLAEYVDKYKTKFKNKVNVTFEGDIKNLSSDAITISGITDVTYTGKALEPIVVTDGDKTLTPGTDYTITYTNNINAGTAKATITGITNLCIGSRDIEFTIAPAPVTVTAEAKSKTFGESDPEFTATVTGLVNNESPDLIKYTITRTEGENAGEYTITPKGDEKQGNYAVRFVDATLTITKATPKYTLPVIPEQKCNATLNDIALPEGFAFAPNSEELSIGENILTLTYNPDENNYETVTGIKVTITVKDHEYGTPTYTWTNDGKTCTATVVCKNDKSHTITETATITSEITTPATSEAKGTTTYTATFKNEMFKTQTKAVEDIDKLNPENPSTPVSSIDNGGNNVKVWSFARTIYIASTPDSQYKIVDLQGRTIATSTTKSSHEEVNINKEGVYVVIINGKTFKLSL